jgi:AP-3 complex subunit delta-1
VKYIALLALAKIVPTHPKLVAEHRDVILQSIDDADISIRLRSLDLLVGMVCKNDNLVATLDSLVSFAYLGILQANKKNLVDIIKRLMAHLLPSNGSSRDGGSAIPSILLESAYREDIINRIIYICSQNSYANITNFEWYIAVLVDLTHFAGVKVGELLASQLMDVSVRVKSVRQYSVKAMVSFKFT